MKDAAPAKKKRCDWSGTDPLYVAYHDEEWGVPLHDDRVLFEFLVLEGAQAGLSWSTILRKRDAYRRAFDRFDPRKVARYEKRDRKSTRLNSSHLVISYAVFCLKKKKKYEDFGLTLRANRRPLLHP